MEKIDNFKNRFNEALELRNKKAVDIHRLTGISESTISQYRSGYAEPKKERLARIASALNVNPSWLMGLDVPMIEYRTVSAHQTETSNVLHQITYLSLKENELLSEFRMLNEQEQDSILNIMKAMKKG